MLRCSNCSPRIRRVLTSSGTSSGSFFAASVFGRSEVLEREHAVEAHRLGQRQRLVEFGLGLAWKSDDHIGRKLHLRDGRADSRDEIQVLFARVTAPHARQRAGRTRLHRQVHVLADCGQIAHRGDQTVGRVPRMRARKANAAHAGHVVDRLEQRGKVARGIVGRLIVIDDLPEELHFRLGRWPPRARTSARISAFDRMRSWPRVYGTTQNAQKSLQPSMMVT